MTRYMLLAVTCPDDALPADGTLNVVVEVARPGVTVQQVAAGSAPAVLVAAAGRCTAAQLHHARVVDLPREHRRRGQREWEEHLTASATARN